MSGKISVVSISLALIALLCCSCARVDGRGISTLFESSFSAEVTVLSGGGEYEATITLGNIKSSEDGTEAEEFCCRDGNISYTYPDTVSGISAVRVNGEVTVNVCGITITPSENIAQKYTSLIDMADIRSSAVDRIEHETYEGRDCSVLYVERGDECARVYIERESKFPVMIKTDTVTMTFISFTKL